MPDEDPIDRRLRDRGVFADFDDHGQVLHIRLSGEIYDDDCIDRLAEIDGLSSLDVRETAITKKGCHLLRSLMPDTDIICGE